MNKNFKLWILMMFVPMFGHMHTANAASCTISLINNISFGNYDPINHNPTESVGTLVYRCNGALIRRNIKISLSKGNANSFNRFLLNGNNQLYYNLYLDINRQQIFGDGTLGSDQYVATGLKNSTITVPIYGRIAAKQDVETGIYSDKIIVTIDF